MADRAAEIPLRGGRTTTGVVRIGDTVRRPRNLNSDFVRRLLGHFAERGFEAAPTSLGSDEHGREIFTFIEGDVPAELAFHSDQTLGQAARLIRRFHDLGAELVAGDSGAETICHNDLSPCNFVFRAGAAVAILDFDAAAPGSRAHDLGYAAWLWLDMGSPEISAAEQRGRLARFLSAYGASDIAPILAAMLDRQSALSAEADRAGRKAMADWAADCLAWTERHSRTLSGD